MPSQFHNLVVVALIAGSTVLAAPLAQAETINPNASIEAQVRTAFADLPEMIPIAKCESNFRQFSAPGVVLHGGTDQKYIGIFQIGERLHTAAAAALGDDIFTVAGNIAYARKLFNESGTLPWRGCVPVAGLHGATSTASPAVITTAIASIPVLTSPQLTANLMLGMTHEQVRTLQQLLNSHGFPVAASGVGSSGHESILFGPLTQGALRRFQCAKKIICQGSEATTGYGLSGPMTRAALATD